MNRILSLIKRFWTSGIIIRGKEALKEDPMNIRTMKKAWWDGRVTRGLTLSATALATVLVAALAASAQKWHYDLYVQHERSARNVGKTEGDVSYKKAGIPDVPTKEVEGCYKATINGSVKDTAVDGNSVKVYFRARDCGLPNKYNKEVGFAGKPEDPPDQYKYTLDRVKDASVEICTWTKSGGTSNASAKVNTARNNPDSQLVVHRRAPRRPLHSTAAVKPSAYVCTGKSQRSPDEAVCRAKARSLSKCRVG